MTNKCVPCPTALARHHQTQYRPWLYLSWAGSAFPLSRTGLWICMIVGRLASLPLTGLKRYQRHSETSYCTINDSKASSKLLFFQDKIKNETLKKEKKISKVSSTQTPKNRLHSTHLHAKQSEHLNDASMTKL